MTPRYRLVLALAVLLLAPMAAGEAQAQNCNITATQVVFGNYDVFTPTPLDSTGSVTVQCLLGLLVRVHLSRGSSPTFLPRTMLSGGNVLQYNLHLNSPTGPVWGDNSSGTSQFAQLLSALFPVTVTVYGRIPAQQDAAAGSYSDTVIATVIF